MTRKANGVLVIEPERPRQCDVCGKVDELRPYGKNGACICSDCAMADERTTLINFYVTMLGMTNRDAEKKVDEILEAKR